MGPEAVCTICTDAAGTRGWGAPLSDSFLLGTWSKVAMREGINWKKMWVLKEALGNWREQVKRKLVLVRMDNAAAVAYAYHGAGLSGQLTRLAREIKESEIGFECPAVVLHITGKGNAVADALSRFSIKASGGDPYPDRELRSRLRAMVVEHCGPMDVDMRSGAKGLNAWCARPRSPARSAF